MNYTEETALRLLRAAVAEHDTPYCKPLQRDMLRQVLRVVDDLRRENTTLRQKQPAKQAMER